VQRLAVLPHFRASQGQKPQKEQECDRSDEHVHVHLTARPLRMKFEQLVLPADPRYRPSGGRSRHYSRFGALSGTAKGTYSALRRLASWKIPTVTGRELSIVSSATTPPEL
jgi:hypothetical protein